MKTETHLRSYLAWRVFGNKGYIASYWSLETL